MRVDDFHSAHAATRSDLFEDEFLSIWQLQKGQVFRRRANENEIVVLGIVQGKQTTALDANLLMKFSENTIESVNGQHFADSRVMIKDRRAGVLGAIVIAHADVWSAYKSGVAEDNPRLLRAGEKSFPEYMKGQGQIGGVASQAGFRGFSRQKAVRGNCHDGGQGSRHQENPRVPPAVGLA